MLDYLRRFTRWIRRRAKLFFVCVVLALLVTAEGPPPAALETGVGGVVSEVRFDFTGWEIDALWAKFTHWLLQPQRYVQEADRSAFVRDYAALVMRALDLERQIETVYADPQVSDPDAATAALRAELAGLRATVSARQLLAESIIEEQIGTILVQEGLGLLGQPFPPVGLHFTPLPYVLVISPRERIEPIYQAELEHGLGVVQRVAIEEAVEGAHDVSSLVTGIGGLSAWPAMLLEWPSLDWVSEVGAHEWTHHYLYLRPLGWAYDSNQEARTINETTASIVGIEVGRRVLARYYPDLLPPPPAEEPPQGGLPPEPPEFDFRAEMYETRVEVDRLLAEGRIEEAEQYMEERRAFFWENDYRIRRLNQAYFAFHGSYADAPGASGEDPIGPAVLELRERSPSLQAFLSHAASITTLEELLAVLNQLSAGGP
jgi:hypothetical protein